MHAEGAPVVLYGVDAAGGDAGGLTFVTTIERAADLKPLLDALPPTAPSGPRRPAPNARGLKREARRAP